VKPSLKWKAFLLLGGSLLILFIFGYQWWNSELSNTHGPNPPLYPQDSKPINTPGIALAQDQPLNITLGFSQLGSESEWRIANTNSILMAAEDNNIKLLYRNAEQSQSRQIEAIRNFIRQKVDVIAISPVVQYGWDEVLLEAKQAGIPVIVIDRSVEVKDTSLFVTFMGSDFYAEGQKAGKYLIDKLMNRPSPISIVELKGTRGSTPSIERKKGFEDVLNKERPELKITKSEFANFTYNEGKSVMRTILDDLDGKIDVLYAHNDDMALGAIEAIEEFGLTPGKDILIISVDGTKKAFEKMAAGKINCVVECNPLLGPQLMLAVKELMEGRNLPKRIVTKESIFTEGMAAKELSNRKY